MRSERDSPAPAAGARHVVVSRVASAQQGAISVDQLHAAGLDRAAIRRRVRDGRLIQAFRGVYFVGHTALARWAWEAAGVLATDGGVLCGATAAHMDGLGPRPEEVHIVAPTHKRNRAGLIVHRGTIAPKDIRRIDGLPVTTPTRTLKDLAPSLSPDELERMAAQALVLRCATAKELREAGLLNEDDHLTRSEAERLLRRLVRQARLPAPITNARRLGYEVDAVWDDQRVVVELDGFHFHGHRAAFERDRRKSADLEAAGYRVLRFTWRQLTEDPAWVVARLAAALAR